MTVAIRQATPFDVPVILSFICALADYEQLLPEVTTDEVTLMHNLFCPNPKAFVILADVNGQSVGFALYFYNFSTFAGKPGIYLEDIYVMPEHRGHGIGKQLMAYLAKKAISEQCCKLEWCVLKWNLPAIAVYESLSAEPMDQWRMYQVTGDELARLAGHVNRLIPAFHPQPAENPYGQPQWIHT
jgi:GNAT superfamily N-acetyltransferase